MSNKAEQDHQRRMRLGNLGPYPNNNQPALPGQQVGVSYFVYVETRLCVYFSNGSLYYCYIGQTQHILGGPITYPVFARNRGGGAPIGYRLRSGPAQEWVSVGAGQAGSDDWRGAGVVVFRVTRLDGQPEDLTPSPPPAQNYYITNNNQTINNNISAPPAPSPTPTNPLPLGTPARSPGYAPFSKPTPTNPKEKDKEKEKEKEDIKIPGFNPLGGGYSPIGAPYPPPVVTNQTVNDPLINAARKVDPNFGLKTNNSSRTTTQSGAGGATTTTTTPVVPSDPFKVTPFIPPFFNPVSPIDPTKQKPFDDEKKTPPPPDQTPAGNNCCVPTPINQKLDAANKKLDLLTPTSQLADFTLLNVINAKLGNQVPGGLSGFLGEKFTKLWKSRVVDRTLNLLVLGASFHNALMLSRDLGTTLIETTSNVLAAIGIKDADGTSFDFNTIIGQQVENFVKSVVGTDNYTNLKQTFVKANRILTAGANLIDSVRSMQNTLIEAQEIVGGWVAKIGNGLSQDGIVNDNTIDWMPERPDFKNPFFRAQQTIEDLTNATETVNQLASSVIETQELKTQIATNYTEFKNEMTTKGNDKKTAETTKKTDSASPDISNIHLKEGTRSDGN